MRAVTWVAAVGILLGLVGSSVDAENPRLHLKLENVTALEAAEALGKAANVRIEIGPVGRPPDAPLLEKASFDWSDITLANALRQLTGRYPLSLALHRGNRYELFPIPAVRPAPAFPSLVEKNGVRIFIRSISINSARNIHFDGGRSMASGGMSLNFGAEVRNGDADTNIGVNNVVARDDQGNILSQDRLFQSSIGIMAGATYPDEWSGNVPLPSPHPKARKLAWLEGELLGYRVYRKHELELPLAEKGKPVTFQGATVELSRFESSPALSRTSPAAQDIYVEARITMPPGTPFLLDSSGSFRLIGKSGKIYSAQNRGMSTTTARNETRMRVESILNNVEEPIEHLRLVTLDRSDPQRLLSFRMTGIPLPEEAPFVPARNEQGRPLAGANVPVRGADFAFRQAAGGGALVSSIRLAGRPVTQGALAVGLAAKEGDGWGPIRWTDADVAVDGVVRLDQLKPGTYRMVRVYHGREQLPLPPGGRWQNAEVIVTIAAGKDVAVPPLLWDTAKSPPVKRPR